MSQVNVTETKPTKPKKASRWNGRDPKRPRYDQKEQAVNDKLLRSQPGWARGAKVVKR
jgi:hypothetical protein